MSTKPTPEEHKFWGEAHYELGKHEALLGKKLNWIKRINFIINYIERRVEDESNTKKDGEVL